MTLVKRAGLIALVLVLGFSLYLAARLLRDDPREFDEPAEHFKYGSTGGDRLIGIPTGVWNALPEMCSDYMPAHYQPGSGYRSLGLLYEDGRDYAIGTTSRFHGGFDRVFLNCAACHTGTYRVAPEAEPQIVLGMPANNLDLDGFRRMITHCVLDPKFNPIEVVAYAQRAQEAAGTPYGWLDRKLLTLFVPAIKEVLLLLRYRFGFLDEEVEPGPGRFDTFNPAKALLNFPFDRIPPHARIGVVDYPSIWNQQLRAGMNLHWDGNNDSVDERNRSAGFGSGALPVVADEKSFERLGTWTLTARPPSYPLPIDAELARRGAPIYASYCADCHGRSGEDFSGKWVGEVTPIADVATDPCRLDNYTPELASAQNTLYAGYEKLRFRHFKKTYGYANMPLDGLWLRAPYLHNGSVPTLRDLLEPSDKRPSVFYRGDDLIDPVGLGFRSDRPAAHGRPFFRFETRCIGNGPDGAPCASLPNPENRFPEHHCVPGPWAGNGNRGHEGGRYGTDLSDRDKDALVEYLKGF